MISASDLIRAIVAAVLDNPVISMNRDRSLCSYKNHNGDKCFVGVLIPDEVYHPSIEAVPIIDLVTDFGVHKKAGEALSQFVMSTFAPHTMLLHQIEMLHCRMCATGEFDREYFIERISRIAKDYNTDVSDLTK